MRIKGNFKLSKQKVGFGNLDWQRTGGKSKKAPRLERRGQTDTKQSGQTGKRNQSSGVRQENLSSISSSLHPFIPSSLLSLSLLSKNPEANERKKTVERNRRLFDVGRLEDIGTPPQTKLLTSGDCQPTSPPPKPIIIRCNSLP